MTMKYIKFKKDYFGYNFIIYYKRFEVGYISLQFINKFIYISSIEIYKKYRKKGIGKLIVDYLFNRYKRDYIIGETLYSSRGFWNKMIKRHYGMRKNIHYCNNCTSSFILCRNESIKCNKLFNNNKEFYKLLIKCNK